MNQAALNFDHDPYPDGFWYWLTKNRHIRDAFDRKALRMARTGRKHYSARCIIENIRFETDLTDSDTLFKINNNFVPGLARLWMEAHGKKYPKFFHLREMP